MNPTQQMHDKKQEMMKRYQRMIKQRVVQSGYIYNVGYVNEVSLMVNNIKAKYPVRHIKCEQIKDWQHICGCLEQIEFATQELKCNQLSLMNQEDLLAAEDHYNIITSMHFSTQQITLFAGEPFTRLWRSNEKLNILNNKIYQELYTHIKKQSKIEYGLNDFFLKLKQDPRYNQLDQISFNAHCIIDFVKLNIPMRFKQCKHLDCFDFTSIIFQLEKILKNPIPQKQKMIRCGITKYQEQCQSQCYPSYDALAENLALDEQLQEMLRDKHSSCYQIFYNMYTCEMMFSGPEEYEEYVDDLFENSICNEIIYKFITPATIKCTMLSRKIQLQFISIINTKQRDESFQNYKYQNIHFKFICPLSEQLKQVGDARMIDYPGRCINCKQIQFADLPNLIQHFYALTDSENKYYQCPLCQFNYNSDVIPYQIFRFDEQIKKLMLKFNSNIDEKIQELYYNGEQKLLKYFQKNERLESQYRPNQLSSGQEYLRSINCIISKRRLNIPLKIIYCPYQSRVSFSSFYEIYQKSQYKLDMKNPIHLCGCQSCQGGITDLCQLQFDDIAHQILQQLPEQFQQLENYHIIYDYKTKSITQVPNNNILSNKKGDIEKCQKLTQKVQIEQPNGIDQYQK